MTESDGFLGVIWYSIRMLVLLACSVLCDKIGSGIDIAIAMAINRGCVHLSATREIEVLASPCT